MRRLTLFLSLTYAYKNPSNYESVNLPRLADIESQKNEFYKNPPLAPPKAENKPVPKITSKSTALLVKVKNLFNSHAGGMAVLNYSSLSKF